MREHTGCGFLMALLVMGFITNLIMNSIIGTIIKIIFVVLCVIAMIFMIFDKKSNSHYGNFF